MEKIQFTKNNPLTLEQLKEMEHGIFATDTTIDSPEGINMNNSGKPLLWVAVRGRFHDWAIYIHYADRSESFVKDHGDKVIFEGHIKKLVPCTDEAFEMYRY